MVEFFKWAGATPSAATGPRWDYLSSPTISPAPPAGEMDPGKLSIDLTQDDLNLPETLASFGDFAGGLVGGILGPIGSLGPEGAHIGQVPEAVGNAIGAAGDIDLAGNLPVNPVLGGTLGGGGEANIGAIPGAMLDIIGLPGRAVERTVAGRRAEAAKTGGRDIIADALAFAAGTVLGGGIPRAGDVLGIAKRTPEALPEDLHDRLLEGEDIDRIADELVARNAGFTNDPLTNLAAGIVYDPTNLIGGVAGKAGDALAGAGAAARAGTPAGAATRMVGTTYNIATHNLSRGQQVVVNKFVGPVTSGVFHALGTKPFQRVSGDLADIATEYADNWARAGGVANAHLVRSVVGDRLAQDAERFDGIAERFSDPADVERLLGETLTGIKSVAPKDLERAAEERLMAVAPTFDGMTDAEVVQETIGKLAAITGSSPEDAARVLGGKVDLQTAQMVHLFYWGHLSDGLAAAKRATPATRRIDVERLTPIAPDTLTVDRARGALALSGDAFRQEALRYSDLRRYAGDAWDEAKARGFIETLLARDALPTTVIPPGTRPRGIPRALGDWRAKANAFGYELGFAPEGGWRVIRDADGNVIRAHPFVHVTSDADPLTMRNPLGRFADAMTRGVSQTAIILDSRLRFARSVKDLGVNRAEADQIHRAILNEARDSGVAPRGLAMAMPRSHGVVAPDGSIATMSLNRFDEAFLNTLGPDRFGKFVADHDPATLMMRAFQGNFSRVGATQTLSGAVKRVPRVGPVAAAVAEGVYPLVRFRLNPLFQLQEWVESPFWNLVRGAEKQAVSKEVRDLYGAMSELPDMRYVSEAAYYLNIAGSQAIRRGYGSGPLGVVFRNMPDVRHTKEEARVAQVLSEHGEAFRDATRLINPKAWNEMEQAYGTKDPRQIAFRFAEERMALSRNPQSAMGVFNGAATRPTDADFAAETVWNAFRESFRLTSEQAFKTHYFNPRRGWLERSINHPYLGIYPASYMWGKVLPEFARFLLLRPFGRKAPLAGAAALQRTQEAYLASLAGNTEFQEWLKDNKDAVYLANMLLPGTPGNLPANLPAYARHISEDAAAGREVTGDTVLREVGDTASYAFGPVRGTTTVGKGVLDLGDDIFATLERAARELDGMTARQ